MRLEHRRIQVWDPFVRVFHWSLVLVGILAWASAEEQAWLHERAGYFILVLIGLRVLWGLVGSHHARFSEFLRGPRQTLAYLRDLRSVRPQHYLGHNPAGGWMVVALLCAMLSTGASGALIGTGEGEFVEELHEGLAERIRAFLAGRNVPLVGEVPYHAGLREAVQRGVPVTALDDEALAAAIGRIWAGVRAALSDPARTAGASATA